VKEVFLTFDVEGPPFNEDYMDDRALRSLLKTLHMMNKYELKGLFFILGSVVGKIRGNHEVMELLQQHEIGYHSSSHCIRPMIFEYTDVENYDEAVEESSIRENSTINLRTGRVLGEGGILSLKRAFPDKKIQSFRAPFLCWTPPHLEAMRICGLRYDFSTRISEVPNRRPRQHRGITFYPHPISIDSRASPVGSIRTLPRRGIVPAFLFSDLIKQECTVLMKHPAMLTYHTPRRNSNSHFLVAKDSVPNKPRGNFNSTTLVFSTEMLFSELKMLQEIGTVKITPELKMSSTAVDLSRVNCREAYEMSMWAPRKFFGVKPKYLFGHFKSFLNGQSNVCEDASSKQA